MIDRGLGLLVMALVVLLVLFAGVDVCTGASVGFGE
jgi:hypothetical protein